MNRAFAILVGIGVALGASAATFRLEHDGKPVRGGEVCLFDSKSLDGPLERLTTFSKVECFPADGDVALSAGTWNIFARHPEGLVSHVLLLARDGRVAGDRRVIVLESAGRARLDLAPTKSESIAFYVENTGVVLPAVPGESHVLLPTGSRLFPLVMQGGSVRSVGAGFVVSTSAPFGVPRPVFVSDRVDFAMGVVADKDAFARIPARERLPGEIVLASRAGKAMPTANRMELVFQGEEGLALFRAVPATEGGEIVRVAGEGWSSTGGQLTAFRAEGPLRVVPTTTLTVRWSVIDDVVRLAEEMRATAACSRGEAAEVQVRDVPGASQPGLTLALAQCPALQATTSARAVRKASCKVIASAVLEERAMSGSSVLNSVAPGAYLLRLGYGTLPPAFETIEVRDSGERAAIELRYDRWFGRVTRGGEPLYAQVGIGEGAVSDPSTGEYFTVSTPLPPPPAGVASRLFTDPVPISVIGCESEVELLYAPDEGPIPNTRFDIEIEPNVVSVNVVDAGTSKPVPEAAVDMNVRRRDRSDAVQFGGELGKADETGSFEITDLPPSREIEVCASRDDYHRRCAERFTLGKVREMSLTIALERAKARTGRVFHPAVGGGNVTWYSADGRRLESAQLAADGSFSYKQRHAAGEVVSVVSAGAPLLMLRQPHLRDDEPFNIEYPSAPVRSFNVSLSPEARESKGFVSLSIGDIVVPLNVLSQHLRHRGGRPLFLAPGEIAVRDIVASAQVSFIFAPMSWTENHAKNITIDYFYIPAANALPRVAAGSDFLVTVGN